MSKLSNIKPQKHDRLVIVGAGVFGLATARELAQRGYSNITVLDRGAPPVIDGSSVDISRVIRPDYADDFYAKLGLEAMKLWEGEFRQFFYQSGMLCAAQDSQHPYLENSKKNLERLGQDVVAFEGNEARHKYPAIHGDLSTTKGYYNTRCGWANAEGAIRYLAAQCTLNGVSFVSGTRGTVTSLSTEGDKVVELKTLAGETIRGDHIILATGAWTPHLLRMEDVSISNSQPVAFMQLTPDEAKDMTDCPVMIDLSTGWFAFPPQPGTNILKMARHGYGYEIPRESYTQGLQVSAPDLIKDNASSNFIPDDAEQALRAGLRVFLPKFQHRPFLRQRLCWYTDTPKGDFIVDHHPEYANLFMATGGSGHAFKFLPIIGRCIADAFELIASREQCDKWGWKAMSEPISKGDGSRGGPSRRALTYQERANL